MIGDQDLDALQLEQVLSLADDHRAAVDPGPEPALDRGGDRKRRLARPDDDHPRVLGERIGVSGDLDRVAAQRHGLLGRPPHVAGAEAGLGDPQDELAQRGHPTLGEVARVGDPSRGRRRAHAIATSKTSPA